MNLADVVMTRYSTKEFDANKKIPAEQFEQLKTTLHYFPSSLNAQPWHFIIADTEEGKKRVAKGATGFSAFNEPKILDASHVVVFCAKTDYSEEYNQNLLECEDKDGRFALPEHKEMTNYARNAFLNIHRYDLKDLQHWMEKQVYLAMGGLLLGAPVLGIDALPMEGVDMKALDEEFGLREKGFTAVGVVALGYRSDSDFNAELPKSRLPEEDILTVLD